MHTGSYLRSFPGIAKRSDVNGVSRGVEHNMAQNAVYRVCGGKLYKGESEVGDVAGSGRVSMAHGRTSQAVGVNGQLVEYRYDGTVKTVSNWPTDFEVNVHGQFGGIVYYQEIQPLTFDCHAMYLPEVRGFSKEIGLAFWRYILTNTTVQCVTSFAARKFRNGQMYCAMIGLKRVGTIKKYFKGVDDVTFYSATREELIDFLNHRR